MKRIGQIVLSLILSVCIAMSNILLVSAASVGQVKSLKAKTVAYNSVTLSWKKVSGATGYEVQQYSGKKWKTLKKDNKKTTYTIKKLKTGTKYKFRVRAYKKSGSKNTYGKYSKTLSVTPVPAKVKAKVSSVTVNSAKLSWSKVSGASGYYVQKKDGKKWKTVATLKSKSKSYTVKKLSLGKTYTYRVVAFRTVNKEKIKGTASSSLTVKPAVPQPKSVKASDVKPGSAVISWSKASGAEGYQVQKKDGGNWVTVANVKNATKVTVTLVPNVETEFRVRAYKGKYYSAASSSVKALCSIDGVDYLDTLVGKDTVLVSWDAASGVSGYEVQLLNKGEWTTYATVTDTEYELSVEAGKKYEIRVVSFVTADGADYYGPASEAVVVEIEKEETTTKAPETTKPTTTKPTTTKPTTTKPSVTVPVTEPSTEATTVPVTTAPVEEPTVTVPTTVPTATVPSTTAAPTTTKAPATTAAPTTTKAPTTAAPTTTKAPTTTAAPTTTQKPAAAPTVNAVKYLKASVDNGNIKLSWSAPSGGAAGYEVKILKEGNWETVADVTSRTVSVTVEPNKEHQFQVLSYKKANGEKYYGDPVTVSGTYTVPKATSLTLNAKTTTKDGAKLSWSKVSGISGYRVEKKTDTTAWETALTTEETSATLFIKPGEKTYFRVATYVVYNSAKYFGDPSPEKYTTFTVTKPGSALTKGTVSKDGVFLKWTSVTNVDGYEVQRLEGSNWVKVITSATNSCTAPLIPNIDNELRVVSYVTIGGVNYYSDPTETKTAKYTLASASGLKSTAVTKSSVALTWSAAKDAYAYEIQQNNGSEWIPVDRVFETSAEASIVPGITYKFRVVPVVDSNGKDYNGGASNEISVTYNIPPVFALKPTASDDTSITLAWSAAEGAEGYVVYMNSEEIARVTDTTLTVTELTKATAYSFTVKAIQTVDGTEYYSVESNAATGKTTPGVVTGLAFPDNGVGQSTVALVWNKEAVADGYTVYKKIAGGDWEEAGDATGESYVASGLKSEADYEFRVAAFHKANGSKLYGEVSDTVSARTNFSKVEGLTLEELYNYYIARIDWLAVDGAKFEAYYQKNADSEYEQVNTSSAAKNNYSYTNGGVTDIGLDIASAVNCLLTMTWNEVPGASKYIVQSRYSSAGIFDPWTTVATSTGTSASFMVAPDTEYDFRVVAYDANFKVCAYKEKDGEKNYTAFEYLYNIPGTVSDSLEGIILETPAFNPSDKATKTAYVLKVVQAINNTKAEKNLSSVKKTELVETSVDKLEVKAGALTFWSWWNIADVPGVDVDELMGITAELNTNKTYTGSVENGQYKYTLSDGTKGGTNFNRFVTPSTVENAYLYNVSDINSIDSRITGITYSKSGTRETIELTLAQEVATKANDATPLHKGLYEDFSGTAGASGVDDGRVTVGPTKITVIINENGTLDYMKTSTTFEMYSQMTEEGISFRMTVNGTRVEDTYEFTR